MIVLMTVIWTPTCSPAATSDGRHQVRAVAFALVFAHLAVLTAAALAL